MRRRAAVYRDIAVAASSAGACVPHLLGERWLAAGLAVAAGIAWIVVERRRPKRVDWYTQAAFLFVGLLLLWRFAEVYLWITVAGVWFLVAAADLSRLVQRFPVDSPPMDQRLLVSRRVQHLALLGAASAAVVGVARFLTLQLRLVAVALLAVFVVMVAVRTIRSIAGL
ncbi:MAG: hypothetical protein KOO61_02450, partial [Spirochaetales bacterium]|nr:hypothetical protein [Spirochaetales bacterium]